MEDECYPPAGIEDIGLAFGVAMEKGPTIEVGQVPHASLQPLGTVVFNAWAILHDNGQLSGQAIVDAFLSGELPKWFEQQVRAAATCSHPLGYNLRALIQGDCFGQIDWDWERLARLTAAEE